MGLQDTAIEVGLGAVIVIIAANALGKLAKSPAAEAGKKIGDAAKTVDGIIQSIPTAVNNPVDSIAPSDVDANYAAGRLPGMPASINAGIDQYFDQSRGIFGSGILGFDPTSWVGFRAWFPTVAGGFVLPSNPTGYFNAKVAQYQNRGYTKPGGLGY